MKITVENSTNPETEIVIKGDVSSDEVKELVENLLSIIDHDKASRIIIGKKDEKEFILSVKEIECFMTSGNMVIALHNSEEYRINQKLFEIEQSYVRNGFRRISKNSILNCNYIKYLQVEFSGNYTVVTKSNIKMIISRRYVGNVKRYIKEEL